VLDLVPISSGSDASAALRNSVELARRCEELGYARYWFAEHHLNPGVAGASPAVVMALVAGATSRMRLGSGAVQLGHRTALATVEEFGLLDALHPGRFDMGLGRSGGQRTFARPPSAPRRAAPNGLRIPAPFSFAHLIGSPRSKLQQALLQQPQAVSPDYGEQVDDILALLEGTYVGCDGTDAHAVPGEGADVQVWVLGSSGGQSAEVAGRRGLRFAANYHVSPATVLEAVDAYRAAFEPSATLERPYVAVSADVVVAAEAATARELAAGYGPWVRSIRTGQGAIPFPSPEEARSQSWTNEDAELVADRVETQFVGSPAEVVAGLAELEEATDADELVITTITHDPADRTRSYELLAHAWAGTSPTIGGASG